MFDEMIYSTFSLAVIVRSICAIRIVVVVRVTVVIIVRTIYCRAQSV